MMSKCRCGQLKEVTHACIDYVLPELKCPHCRHVPHGDVCYALKGCRCHYNSHSPAEPKCADCGDADHVGRECGATKFAGDEIGVCRCYRPALHGGTR